MTQRSMDGLHDDSRLWCFAASRELKPLETQRLEEALARFLDTWAAHGADLSAACGVRHSRFLFVAVDERADGASGCSIDALSGELRRLERELDVSLLDGGGVWFRDQNGSIEQVDRGAFRRLASEGRVGADTVVFDLTATRLGDLREGLWETRAGAAWHATLLPIPADAPTPADAEAV